MPSNHVEFTREMREAGYTILVPNMLEFHFSLIVKVLRLNGYNAELLTNSGPNVMAEGLKYVHNDTCVPALLVIGQFLDALHSGKYDINKVALIITQTGGGCRASNYIYLLRKALKKAGLEHLREHERSGKRLRLQADRAAGAPDYRLAGLRRLHHVRLQPDAPLRIQEGYDRRVD